MHEFVIVLDAVDVETCWCHIECFRYPFERILLRATLTKFILRNADSLIPSIAFANSRCVMFRRIRIFRMLFPKSRFLRLHSVIFVPSQIRESKPVIAFQRE